MSFLEPTYMFFMFPALLVFAYFILTNKNALQRVFSKEVLEKLTINPSVLDKKAREVFLLMALFLMIIALARPVYDKGKIEVAVPSTTLLIALDVSKSMEANDFYPTRLTLAQKKIENLLDMLDGVKVGIIAFSDRGYLVSPISEDIASVKFLLQNIHKESLRSFGTDFIVPIDIASNFTNSNDADLLIITDGGDKKEFKDEIELAKEHNIRVSILTYATKKGSPIKDDKGYLKNDKGDIVVSSLNEDVKELALETKGMYIQGAYGEEDIKQIASMLQEKRFKEKQSKQIDNYMELFYYPLILALFLLFASFYSFPKKAAVLLLLLFHTPNLQSGVLDFMEIQKADDAYKQNDYKTAGEIYKSLPNSHESRYDYANSLYKQNDFKGAIKEFEKINTEDKELNFKSKYNLGNSYAKSGDLDKAIESYESALKIKDDEDARYNLEVAKKMKKKKEDKKQDNKNKDEKNDKKDKQQNKNDNNKQDSDKQKNEKQKEQKKEADKQQSNDAKKNDEQKKEDKNGSEEKERQEIKREKMSDSEYKRWQELLQKQKQKTLPLEIRSKNSNDKDAKNVW